MRALLLAALVACYPKGQLEDGFIWEGVPDGRICDFNDRNTGGGAQWGGTCLSGGRTYACVIDGDARKVVCQLQFTEILCTRIVNVEATCNCEGVKR